MQVPTQPGDCRGKVGPTASHRKAENVPVPNQCCGNNQKTYYSTDLPQPDATLEGKLYFVVVFCFWRPNFKNDFTSTQKSMCLALQWHRAGHRAKTPQRLEDGFYLPAAVRLRRETQECGSAHIGVHAGHSDEKVPYKGVRRA